MLIAFLSIIGYFILGILWVFYCIVYAPKDVALAFYDNVYRDSVDYGWVLLNKLWSRSTRYDFFWPKLQEAVIELGDSPEFQRSHKHLRAEKPDHMEDEESDGDEPQHLTRSNAFVERSHENFRHPAKQPAYYRLPVELSESDDDPDKDLAWFFKTHQPDIDKYSQIAWCRTFANCLAAQLPKNRPKTYKKQKTASK